MTAEIAIMNKEAIAIAADSALTLTEEKGEKIFTSANKIFSLSKFQPVGIMIYGNASFMGVPWETIIKSYRKLLGYKEFNQLEDYYDDFLLFLSSEKTLFPESEQDNFFMGYVYSFFNSVVTELKEEVESIIKEKGEITENEIKLNLSKIIKSYLKPWEDKEYVFPFNKNHFNLFKTRFNVSINDAKKTIFEQLPLTKSDSEKLTEIAINFFLKSNVIYPDISGVVIAGFGKNDIFPVIKSFLIEGMAINLLKHKENKHTKISFQSNAVIVPFAQSEMVATFMEGIDPNYQVAIENDLIDIFDKYPDILVDNIKKLTEPEKNELKNRLKEISKSVLDNYINELIKYQRKNYVDPVIKVVGILPKDELAAMAESLVNLTSFKRKVSMASETVGGPIDVAVISKGDGFIWIKRKHYFKPELNPHFFATYYKEERNG
jgi:hypothetical protein